MNVAIVGSGYVGLVTGVVLAYIGHDVTCVDLDEEKIGQLQCGLMPIHEPNLAEVAALANGRLGYTTRMEEAIPEADVVFLAVGTPALEDGSPDLSHVRSAAAGLRGHLGRRFTVVVTKSTVPIGSGDWVEALVAEPGHCRPGREFAVVSNPEFLRQGSAVFDSLYPDRIVLGSDDQRALERMTALYEPILEQTFRAPEALPRPDGCCQVPVVATNLASAELIKYAANAFLALKISFINEMAELAEKVGADIDRISEGVGLDARIGGRFLRAGIGWGGSCFGKDTAAVLAMGREYGLAMPIVSAAREVNSRQRERVVERLEAELGTLAGRRIGLLGLAFKPDTDDLRDAPSIDIARRLMRKGARVTAHDPVALERARREFGGEGLGFAEGAAEVATGADAVVLVTEWPEYRALDWEAVGARMRQRVLLDGRNTLDRKCLEAAGFRYVGVGQAGPAPEVEAGAAGTCRK
jgi:UDPglucose 6-dehydrogenase